MRHARNRGDIWSPAQDEKLARLLGQKRSFAECAAEIPGKSRCACIGRARRLGLEVKSKPEPAVTAIRVARSRTRGAGVVFAVKCRKDADKRAQLPAHKAALRKIQQREAEHFEPRNARISITQLTGKTCRWPYGDPDQESFGYCGAHTIEQPYCPYHKRIAYTPAALRSGPVPPANGRVAGGISPNEV